MKILLINNIDFDYAGAEVMVHQLKEGLREKGHDARVLAGNEPDSPHRFSDYTFRSFRADSILRYFLLIYNPFAVWSLYKIMRTFKPDVVHLHTIANASPFILLLLKKVPTVLTIHYHMVLDPTRFEDSPNLNAYKEALSYYFINDKKKPRYYGEKLRFFFMRRFYKNIDMAISCSNFYAEAARDAKLFNKVIVIHNGIKPLPFVPIKNTRQLLYLGRMDRSRGIDILLRAMPGVIQQVPDITLALVGDGDFRDSYGILSKNLGIDNVVSFLGYKDHDAMASLLADATILVVPTIFPDNFPTVCIEAMFVGRPVVASRTGGVPEIVVDGKTGLLVTPSDPEDLGRALIKLLRNPSQCVEFGKAGRNYAEENFSAEAYINRTLEVYERLLRV